MKTPTFPRLVKWMFITGMIFLVCMIFMRLGFFLHFRTNQYSFSNTFGALVLGVHFDIRIVCGIVLFPFLAGNLHLRYNEKKRLSAGSIVQLVITLLIMVLLIIFMKKGHASVSSLIYMSILFALILVWLFSTENCNPFENSVSRKIFKIYFFIITVSLALLYAIDFEHYDYLHQRLNGSVLNYLEDAKISMNMVWETYPVFTLLILVIISTILLYGLTTWLFKKIQPATWRGSPIAKLLIGFVFALLLGIGIFGRLSQYPLRWSDAFFFHDEFKANLSLNPVQSFLSTLEFRYSTYDLKKVKEYYPLMAQYLAIDKADSTTLNYKRTFSPQPTVSTPNIVVVICESFSGYKSSMWGNPLNTTPYFNEMCQQGIFFDRCFTPAYGTARGVWAVITGIPDVDYENTASRNPAAVDQHTIVNDYTGYDKFYFLGGSLSWANIRGLLTNNITDLHLYEEDSHKAKTIDVWGISDKSLFLEANGVFKEQAHPFFAVIQTADNHRPYTIPDEDKGNFKLEKYSTDSLRRFGFQSNEELNAFRYTDFCFETFIGAAKKEKYFKNTIFVFVGDHGIRGDAGSMFPKAWSADGLTTQHVPLLFYSPSLLTPQRITKTCSQLDLLPSVTALARVPFINTTLGKNLFDTAKLNQERFKNSAFLFDPAIKQIGIVTDEYCYVHNLLSGTEDFRSSRNDSVLTQVPGTLEDQKAIKTLAQAYYETARYMMLNNLKKNAGK
ncbi:MAG: sulfatase-like hydrolase/transferase [Ginsengibacter sp.]